MSTVGNSREGKQCPDSPLENIAVISNLKEQLKLCHIRDVCTMYTGALACNICYNNNFRKR